ncbi:hypothetical protein HMPREF3058_08205 [Staphylococcus sp. HMSC068G11]|uniref:hypothetical protein n=1 Tax=Staphylococcus TaxID=1279 RepID=UPI0008A59F58|nr:MULTISPECIES: hypothetical protein [Staphylococcus]MCT6849468.1 hypothetical protein [Staphylococcus epidermidis]OFO15159.1 hypothetical protein HMPREF3058_08205 [Staphylococcus sp. HMSC068G11]
MRYSFNKYKNITDFLNPNKIVNKSIPFSIPVSGKCKGVIEKNGELQFTSKCFLCNFCAFGELSKEYKEKINNLYSNYNFFEKKLADLPVVSSFTNPINSLQTFTEIEERQRIQKWEMGILKNILGDNFKTSEEIPAPSDITDRPGRVDVGIYNKKNEVVLIETKTTLDDALNDERFVEQFSKYNDAIKNSNFNGDYLLCISIGGDEKNLLPPGFLEEDTGNKRSRLYTLLYNEGNRIPLISAAAIWCLSTLYIKEKVDDISTKLIQLFNDQSNIALLSCGIIKYINGSYEIISLKDALK